MGKPIYEPKRVYAQLRDKFIELISSSGLSNEKAEYRILGSDFVKLPSSDYALMRGREVIVDCEVCGFHGQAFTDMPKLFSGRLVDASELVFGDPGDRGIFFATLNAVMRRLGLIDGTVHCRGADAEECGRMLANHILSKIGKVKVAHIGYQPGHVKATSSIFDVVYVTDLNPENIGKIKHGIKILDGSMNEEVIRDTDVACITGSAIVNGTLFKLLECCETYNVKYIIYGVTIKGAAKILGFDTFCPLGT
ncbi:MAG: hypothetical protein B9J98_06700 [Candidatus Terraquivivens tikiterensis]|uniref:Putative heavy-metal chelation domain-containing protein n=1 Tax=Candidatus Terraquivivens tikiterensis TaxID=1980982 RepID=A0A2R7Y1X9_9ARCH|nr:MAG: hypothetical protein B9J98_06700 [Candidatus Terraquivivens tikiterensis]